MSASKEEMLERINMKIYGLNSSIIQDDWAKHELALWRSIRALIEHGPEVSRGFVEKWTDYMGECGCEYCGAEWIQLNPNRTIRVLHEAGVTAKGEK